jgi:uncharacterized protein (DUF983 family)
MAQRLWRTARIDLLIYVLQEGGRRAALFVSPARAFSSEVDTGMPDLNLPTVMESAIRGIACKCPRCGKGKLYSGFLTLRPRCEACGLDYTFIDAGDGPAVFIIMIAGAIVVGCALVVEIKYQPPFWVHAALWLPLILVTTLLPLRAMKALLIALQFHHKAAEGRLIDREPQ